MAKNTNAAKWQLVYLNTEVSTLRVRFGDGIGAKVKVIEPGGVIFVGKTVTKEDCGGSQDAATRVNSYFKRLTQQGRARWERIASESEKQELREMNDGVDSEEEPDDDSSTDASPGQDGSVGKAGSSSE